MGINSILLFVLITSVTPGPNNLSSFIFSAALGYRKTLNYMLGIMTGTCLILLLSGILIELFIQYIENIEFILKWLAAAFIIYLAYKSLTLTVSRKVEISQSPSFISGLMLQLVNPKAIFYGITIYSSFLNGIISDHIQILISAILLSVVTFSMVSLWAFTGSAMMKLLRNDFILNIFGIFMAFILLFYAIRIIDLI